MFRLLPSDCHPSPRTKRPFFSGRHLPQAVPHTLFRILSSSGPQGAYPVTPTSSRVSSLQHGCRDAPPDTPLLPPDSARKAQLAPARPG